jgi:hypothetical protein
VIMIVLAVEAANKRYWFPDTCQLLLLKVKSFRFAFGCTADSLVNKIKCMLFKVIHAGFLNQLFLKV